MSYLWTGDPLYSDLSDDSSDEEVAVATNLSLKKSGPRNKDTGKYEIFVKFFDDAVVQLLADDTNFQ